MKKQFKITLSNIKKSNINEAHLNPWLIALNEEVCNERLLTEFTNRTIDKKITIRQLRSRFKNKFHDLTYGDPTIDENIWIFFLKSNFESIKEINKFMDSYGWYPAFLPATHEKYSEKIDFNKVTKSPYLIISYFPKYDETINIKDYKYLYHLTPDLTFNKIKSIGLTPKNKAKLTNNPERIYLMSPTNMKDVLDTVKALHSTSEHKDLIKKWHILRIDPKKLPSGIKFYDDPMFKIGDGAVWTYQNIPPTAIAEVAVVNITDVEEEE